MIVEDISLVTEDISSHHHKWTDVTYRMRDRSKQDSFYDPT